jgi:hypothetical protein
VLIALALLVPLASSQVVLADSRHDILAFLSLEGMDSFAASDPTLEGSETFATADILYTYNSDRFRVLAEFIWSDTESELERLQAAWQIDDQTMLWFGRFHSISNFWTTEYHHGQFMQTSISRPGVEQWEDESGPLPSHITGLWLEREFSVNAQSAIDIGLTAGLAPKFTGQELVPFDIADPSSGHDMAISGRVIYRPDILSSNQVGLSFASNDIAVNSESSPNLFDLNSIQQQTLGIFSSWRWKQWLLLTNVVFFDIQMRYNDANVNDEFMLGYVQAEYAATEDWTVFSRVDLALSEDDSAYLKLLPAVIAHRNMLGVRWDFADSHALTFELADTSTPGIDSGHNTFNEVRVQWSAVFP